MNSSKGEPRESPTLTRASLGLMPGPFLFVKESDSCTPGIDVRLWAPAMLQKWQLPSNFCTLIAAVMSQVRNMHLEMLQTKWKICQKKRGSSLGKLWIFIFLAGDVFRSPALKLDMQNFKDNSAHFKFFIFCLYVYTPFRNLEVNTFCLDVTISSGLSGSHLQVID